MGAPQKQLKLDEGDNGDFGLELRNGATVCATNRVTYNTFMVLMQGMIFQIPASKINGRSYCYTLFSLVRDNDVAVLCDDNQWELV